MKVGDKVKIVDTDYKPAELQNGETGVIVIKHEEAFEVFGVMMDNGKLSYEGFWNFFPSQLEVIGE